MSELAGQVALVTGGSRGIGAAIARRLARDGAAVAFTYATAADKAQAVAKQIDTDGGRVLSSCQLSSFRLSISGIPRRTRNLQVHPRGSRAAAKTAP
jgi:NAD(P)-dependent dehydrogenase (short-subunit alcohol dehydrogenase family)